MTVTKNAYPVELPIYTDPKGKVFVLPTAEELNQAIDAIDAQLVEVQTLAEASPENKMLQAQIKGLTDVRAQRVSLRDHYLPKAELRTYPLLLPTLAEYLAWQNAPGVRKFSEANGTYATDDLKLLATVLPKSIQGMTEAEVNELHPDIAVRLFAELKALSNPDASTLPPIA